MLIHTWELGLRLKFPTQESSGVPGRNREVEGGHAFPTRNSDTEAKMPVWAVTGLP